MRTSLLVLLVVALLSFPLMAQDSSRWEAFGGYQYLRLNNAFDSSTQVNGQGWDASLTGYFIKHFGVTFGVTADIGGAYKTIQGDTVRFYTYTGGPAVALSFKGRVKLFVHVLAGGTRGTLSATSGGATGSLSLSGLAGLAGGGVDVKIKRHIAVRVIQADWLYYHFPGTPDLNAGDSFNESNNLRFSSGVVYRF